MAFEHEAAGVGVPRGLGLLTFCDISEKYSMATLLDTPNSKTLPVCKYTKLRASYFKETYM